MMLKNVSIAAFVLAVGLTSLAAGSSCDDEKRNAEDPARTVAERYESAKQYRRCVTESIQQSAFSVSATTGATVPGEVQAMIASERIKAAEALETKAEREVEFKGLKWGVGFGFAFASGDRVESAELVDGIVRATKDTSQQALLILEGHNYLTCDTKGTRGDRGCGPYVGVVADSDDILAGVSLGWMWGWKSEHPESSQGFSIGIGALLENDIRDLAPGFEQDQPLPPGETQIRYLEKGRWSAVLFATRSF